MRELSGGELEWSDGMLYPLLHRLAALGLLSAEWAASAEGRRRKYYAITEAGRRELAEQRTQWATVTRALGQLWEREPGSHSVGPAIAFRQNASPGPALGGAL